MKIIGLLTSTDSGKSLLQDYFRKNFKDEIFESINRGNGEQITDTLEELENGVQDLKGNDELCLKILKKHGSDSLMFLKDVNHKKIKNFYTKITNKKHIFVFVRPCDFDQFCDLGIFVTRDLRPRWAVTQHRKPDVETYASVVKNSFVDFTKIDRKDDIMTLKFEELIDDPDTQIQRIIEHCGFEPRKEIVLSTKQYNKWLTEVDLYNINKYVENGKLLKQEELDYLSEVFKDYNIEHSYPENLSIKDIYPKTLEKDINKYLHN
jgi:hypothetical protein